MGFRAVGRVADGYNHLNDQMNSGAAVTGTQQDSNNFLSTWMTEKLPEMITGLAVRVVDDGSGTIAKEILDAGTDRSFFGTVFR